MRSAEAKIQSFTTEFIERIDKVLAGKEAEIMEV
jgi:ribosome recycling factor